MHFITRVHSNAVIRGTLVLTHSENELRYLVLYSLNLVPCSPGAVARHPVARKGTGVRGKSRELECGNGDTGAREVA